MKLFTFFCLAIIACIISLPACHPAAKASMVPVKIGTQTWAKTNLDITCFKNGDAVPQATSMAEWKKASDAGQPAWCCYDNSTTNGKQYGKLYNWFAISDKRGLAPEGWHIPSDAEWTKLVDFLDDDDVGTMMKAKTGWADENNGNDSCGLSCLPGGCRNGTGVFTDMGYCCYFWSSSVDVSGMVWFHSLKFDEPNFAAAIGPKNNGFSVRCIKD